MSVLCLLRHSFRRALLFGLGNLYFKVRVPSKFVGVFFKKFDIRLIEIPSSRAWFDCSYRAQLFSLGCGAVGTSSHHQKKAIAQKIAG